MVGVEVEVEAVVAEAAEASEPLAALVPAVRLPKPCGSNAGKDFVAVTRAQARTKAGRGCAPCPPGTWYRIMHA